MKKYLVVLAIILAFIALSAESCDGYVNSIGIGGGVRGCNGVDINPGYLGANATNWTVTEYGLPADRTDPGPTWSVNNSVSLQSGGVYQYAGYQWKVLDVHPGSLTMSVRYMQLC